MKKIDLDILEEQISQLSNTIEKINKKADSKENRENRRNRNRNRRTIEKNVNKEMQRLLTQNLKYGCKNVE